MKDERFLAADTIAAAYETLVVIPSLNEEATIANVLDGVLPFAETRKALIVVADGGSTDRTLDIVAQYAERSPHVVLIHNEGRIQSAGINHAVELFGGDATFLIRVDAHCSYPAEYCSALLDEALRTGADSVVVSMIAQGSGVTQRAAAAAQNSRIGNGGSRHRMRSDSGEFVDHGHHALMRLSAFRAVGGYDEAFTCNEDAELDVRLGLAGYHIWLTSSTEVAYHPRKTLWGLFRQYFLYGRGRAQNLIKHPVMPKFRQAILLGVFPALLLAALLPVHWLFAVPAIVWLLACAVSGAAIAVSMRSPAMLLSGASAAVMHSAWSFGFWREVILRAFRSKAA